MNRLEYNRSKRIPNGFETRSIFFDGKRYKATARRHELGKETVILFEAETASFKEAMRFLER